MTYTWTGYHLITGNTDLTTAINAPLLSGNFAASARIEFPKAFTGNLLADFCVLLNHNSLLYGATQTFPLTNSGNALDVWVDKTVNIGYTGFYNANVYYGSHNPNYNQSLTRFATGDFRSYLQFVKSGQISGYLTDVIIDY
jgi:hypothetical protein